MIQFFTDDCGGEVNHFHIYCIFSVSSAGGDCFPFDTSVPSASVDVIISLKDDVCVLILTLLFPSLIWIM